MSGGAEGQLIFIEANGRDARTGPDSYSMAEFLERGHDYWWGHYNFYGINRPGTSEDWRCTTEDARRADDIGQMRTLST